MTMNAARDVIEKLHKLLHYQETGLTFLSELQELAPLTREALDEIDDTEYEFEQMATKLEGYERRKAG